MVFVHWEIVMKKIEVIIRSIRDDGERYEKTVFEWTEKSRPEQSVLQYLDLEIQLDHCRVIKNGSEIHLSRYEYGVLSFLARHPGKLFTKEQIFEAVWHKDSDSYLRAVSSTIGRIRQKIEDDKDHPRYIRTISNRGYQFMVGVEE